MTTFRSKLYAIIEAYLQGDIDFEKFAEVYYNYYLDESIEDDLDDKDHAFFSCVHEKIDMTASNPDEESCRYGWIDYEEYRKWLTKELQSWKSH